VDSDDIDVNQLIVRRPDILPRGIRQSSGGVGMDSDYNSLSGDNGSTGLVFDSADASLLQSVAVLGTAVVVCGFGMQFCHHRYRWTKRRRKHLRVAPTARRSRVNR